MIDRFIQQAINQVLQRAFDPTFHPHSYGFRPKRSAHQAVRHAQEQVKAGWGWVVDLDLEALFDRVNHDRLMHRLKQRIDDPTRPSLCPLRRRLHQCVDGPAVLAGAEFIHGPGSAILAACLAMPCAFRASGR